jgi:hypothetical protein
MLRYITFSLFLAAFLSSCNNKDNPAGPNSSTQVQPKAGSSFPFDEYDIDTITGKPVASTRDTSVQTFVQIGMSYLGKTNVSKVVSVTGFSRDTQYLNFESNGDVSALFQVTQTGGGQVSGTPQGWFTIPTGTKTSNSGVLTDTTFAPFPGYLENSKTTLTSSFIDDETTTVKGQSISTTKIQHSLTDVETITPPGTSNTYSTISFSYFATSLGYLTKTDNPATTTNGTKAAEHVSILIDYTEK